MRKIRIIEQISLDGVIQAPGGRDEDGDYAHGGWAMPYFDTDSRQHEGGVLGRAHEHLSTRWIASNRIFRRRERLSGRSKPAFFPEEAPPETADALAHFLTARRRATTTRARLENKRLRLPFKIALRVNFCV